MRPEPIQQANPLQQYLAHKREIDAAVESVLTGGRYITGNAVVAFEKTFADYLGGGECVGVNSGTDALVLALKTLGLGRGDEVITVSHTAVATVAAIELAGCTPVLADIDPGSRCIDPRKIAALVTPHTRAIIPVHLYGHPAPIEEILRLARAHSLRVIEDCAQAHGARIGSRKVGTFGDLGCFSFYPTKNLGALGDGGALVTRVPELAERARQLREYGWKERYISLVPGMNTRLDEIQAAVLLAKLPFLDQDNQRRISLARQYQEELSGSEYILPTTTPGTTHVMHLYVVEHPQRDDVRARLALQEIGTAVHYPQAVHQQPAYRDRLAGSRSLPATEKLVQRILSLPLYPELTPDQVHRVCQAMLAE